MSRLEKVGERIVMGIQRIQYYLYHHLILRVCWGERVQHVVMFLSLYYLCDTIMQGRAIFAGLQRSEWLTYIGIVHLLRASILQQTVEAREGTREKFMGLRSIVRQGGSHFLSFQFPTLLIAIVELFLLSFIFSIPWKFPQYGATWFLFVFSLLGSYFLSVFLNHLLYRKERAMGMRSSVRVVREFASGAFLPLSILSPLWYALMLLAPFSYLVHAPLVVYLEKPGAWRFAVGQCVWIILLVLLSRFPHAVPSFYEKIKTRNVRFFSRVKDFS